MSCFFCSDPFITPFHSNARIVQVSRLNDDNKHRPHQIWWSGGPTLTSRLTKKQNHELTVQPDSNFNEMNSEQNLIKSALTLHTHWPLYRCLLTIFLSLFLLFFSFPEFYILKTLLLNAYYLYIKFVIYTQRYAMILIVECQLCSIYNTLHKCVNQKGSWMCCSKTEQY